MTPKYLYKKSVTITINANNDRFAVLYWVLFKVRVIGDSFGVIL